MVKIFTIFYIQYDFHINKYINIFLEDTGVKQVLLSFHIIQIFFPQQNFENSIPGNSILKIVLLLIIL